MPQKAFDVQYSKAQGNFTNLEGLQELLDQGYTVATDPVMGGGGDILVILDPPKAANDTSGS